MVFVHVHFHMCFAPQRSALFRRLNFRKWSETDVLCNFSLPNALRPTTACTFSTSQLPKVLRSGHALDNFISKCASRHTGANIFDISTSKSAPALKRFVRFGLQMCFAPQLRAIFHLSSGQLARLLFDPPETQNTGKTQCFATSLPFRAPASSLF